MRLVHKGVLALGIPAPAMEAAYEAALCIARAANQRVSAVRADILKGLHFSLAFANHDDRLVDNCVFHEVADIRDFF